MHDLTNIIADDLKTLLPLVTILIIISLYFGLRNIRGVALSLVSVFISIIWTLGIMSLLKVNITVISNIIPVILIAVGSAYGIHVVYKFSEPAPETPDKLTRSRDALSEVGIPVMLAGVTTVAGFLSFIFWSYLRMIREFGIFAALGIFFALLAPLLLCRLGCRCYRIKTRLPQTNGTPARKVIFTPTAIPGTVDLDTELIYPRLHIAGLDLAGAIGDVGIWAEAAAFFPEKIYLETDLSALGMGTRSSTAMDDNPYTKYVIGGDYTFKNGLYINGQYLHGFIYERGKDSLEDYFMFGLEQKFFADKLKVTPIGGGIEIKDFEDLKNNYALIFAPEIAYYPVDNAEIILGLRLINGKTTTTFGKIKDTDEGFVKVKYSF